MLISPPFTHLSQLARKRQSGSSLIEVLVSILLMSFGMLALAGMQAYSIAAQKNAANRAVASMLANELAELVRLNPTAFAAEKYDFSVLTNGNPPTSAPCTFPSCDATSLAATDLTDFLNLVRMQLTDGGAMLSRPTIGGVKSTTEADLWIMWNEASVLNTTQDGTALSSESTADNCPAIVQNQAVLPRCFYMKVQL